MGKKKSKTPEPTVVQSVVPEEDYDLVRERTEAIKRRRGAETDHLWRQLGIDDSFEPRKTFGRKLADQEFVEAGAYLDSLPSHLRGVNASQQQRDKDPYSNVRGAAQAAFSKARKRRHGLYNPRPDEPLVPTDPPQAQPLSEDAVKNLAATGAAAAAGGGGGSTSRIGQSRPIEDILKDNPSAFKGTKPTELPRNYRDFRRLRSDARKAGTWSKGSGTPNWHSFFKDMVRSGPRRSRWFSKSSTRKDPKTGKNWVPTMDMLRALDPKYTTGKRDGGDGYVNRKNTAKARRYWSWHPKLREMMKDLREERGISHRNTNEILERVKQDKNKRHYSKKSGTLGIKGFPMHVKRGKYSSAAADSYSN